MVCTIAGKEEANFLVTWAHPNSLKPVTKGGNSGISHTGDDMRGQNPKLLGSQTMRLYCIVNFQSFCDVQISVVAQSSKSYLWT